MFGQIRTTLNIKTFKGGVKREVWPAWCVVAQVSLFIMSAVQVNDHTGAVGWTTRLLLFLFVLLCNRVCSSAHKSVYSQLVNRP